MLISLPFDQRPNHGFYQHPEAITPRLRKQSFHSPLRDLKLQLGYWFPFVAGCSTHPTYGNQWPLYYPAGGGPGGVLTEEILRSRVAKDTFEDAVELHSGSSGLEPFGMV